MGKRIQKNHGTNGHVRRGKWLVWAMMMGNWLVSLVLSYNFIFPTHWCRLSDTLAVRLQMALFHWRLLHSWLYQATLWDYRMFFRRCVASAPVVSFPRASASCTSFLRWNWRVSSSMASSIIEILLTFADWASCLSDIVNRRRTCGTGKEDEDWGGDGRSHLEKDN